MRTVRSHGQPELFRQILPRAFRVRPQAWHPATTIRPFEAGNQNLDSFCRKSRSSHAQPKTERVIQSRQIISLQMTKKFVRQIAGN
jgi:hypothetical protein